LDGDIREEDKDTNTINEEKKGPICSLCLIDLATGVIKQGENSKRHYEN
jgi:hypothetical protein